MKVGFIGLGKMGFLMSSNLAENGIPLLVYNRTAQSSLDLIERFPSVRIAKSPAEVGRYCDVIFSILADDKAVESVYLTGKNSVLSKSMKSRYWIEMSTIGEATSRRLYQTACENNVEYIDAPVSGSLDAAEKAELVFILGAQDLKNSELLAYFDLMGKQALVMGAPTLGHIAKLLVNSVIHSQNQIIAEILSLATPLQLKKEALLELLTKSAAGSPMMSFRIPLYLDVENVVTFALDLAKKDMNLAIELARKSEVSVPQMLVNYEQLCSASQAGYGQKDMAGMVKYRCDINKKESK
ncbi:putative 2-hydroxy-3-oxopropionate reductase [Vibrio nigripulchritudo SOn1]|uniref:2-hydroxy-3-oxopropionate reductase n=1 Tax=Vibrio nigripulchritudo SOn1 TaxID=1238450 RepID=A0AAV2VTW3_9VIBR|nr:NAD(P)-dependent oxidoreductase [Vibrio nigripulchritudo]CCO47859.1 putative 2-hydroxy-3-oxopropionate reductase [Vibrio nigripulchritudo SOn1]